MIILCVTLRGLRDIRYGVKQCDYSGNDENCTLLTSLCTV